MEQIEGPDDGAIGLEKLPDEALPGIDQHQKIEAVAHEEGIAAADQHQCHDEEGQHGEGLVELHRMAQETVAEVVAPGQAGGRAMRVVLDTGEEAAPAPDNDAGGEGRHEDQAGRAGDAAPSLEQLDGEDGARQGADDAAADARRAAEPEIEGPCPESAGSGTRKQRCGIADAGMLDLLAGVRQPPAIDKRGDGHRRHRRRKVKDGVDDHVRQMVPSAL